jgi:hypothetical protein
MAHLINGNQDVNHDSLTADGAQPRTFQVVTSALWTTVRSRAFAAGVFVGTTLMYAGVRVAQHYLQHGEADSDRPF